ncbi:hypothetical protein QTN47_24995 [Danxiaibacter flavus]|uniref:Alpha-galactosidase n=1 Tax=Danxiaibacter flavus TaxID=3049108 RepID=A0ABV3ZLP0_9BACT|nr:hypothetical protein QNM32_25000 [Chitinophagaceae bacterium DXS]
MAYKKFVFVAFAALSQCTLHAQSIKQYKDSTVISNGSAKIIVNTKNGKISYRFDNNINLHNTVAYVEDSVKGMLFSDNFPKHTVSSQEVNEKNGKGLHIDITHNGSKDNISLIQHIKVFENSPMLLVSVEAKAGKDHYIATRNISPVAILPSHVGKFQIQSTDPRLLDVPFDNDNWVGSVSRKWPNASGTGYELFAVYDNNNMNGIVAGSIEHDFWKTGIVYKTGTAAGTLDSLLIYGGAATADNKSLPPLYGGYDGTHDLVPHGMMQGPTVSSPTIYICSNKDVRTAFRGYGEANVQFNGSLQWKGEAPMYWNSFGVEDVLGARNIMQPGDVLKISDFIASLTNLNSHKPVLSIDSYDQKIYSTEVLKSIGEHGAKNNQQMGFYFIPFAVWTWRDAMDSKIKGSDAVLRDVVLHDKEGRPIFYKQGDFGAYAIDPTHPAVRLSVIQSLLKAKAIKAKFLKIDFLSAGALESTTRYDSSVKSGMQAYNRGMKMVKHLIDSIMGPDIFITQAISPMFPHQYAHTRFVSTDVYSHLRDDQKGFPHYGSTEASLATGSFMWWMQGTLWPYTNLDVAIMKSFQKNPDLTEKEIKVRLYAMMVMGSILGDGSDFRQEIAAERAKKYLDNKALCDYFAHPKVFTPLQFADGDSIDQQMAFYLKADTNMLAMFNFSNKQPYTKQFSIKELGIKQGNYELKDFLTGQTLAQIKKEQSSFSLNVPVENAVLVKIVQR